MSQWLHKNWRILVVVLVVVAFVAGNCYSLFRDFRYVSYVPLLLLAVVLMVVRLEYMFLLTALLTPFAVNYEVFQQMRLSLPVEPMMILFSIIFIFRVLITRSYDTRLIRHPISLLVIAQLLWLLVASVTSQLPLVSFKFLTSRLWFVIPFFFAASQIFSNHSRIRHFFWCYAIGLCSVILISTVKTLSNFSNLQTLHHIMSPYYNDHTAYGCAIALMLPVSAHLVFCFNIKRKWSLVAVAFFGILCVGLLLSYCRAAWLGIVAVMAMYVVIRMGVKLKWIALAAALAVGVFFTYQGEILYKMEKNRQDSSYELADQVKSVSNIATDASNLERLNRWASAFRIWKEHPVVGCGPATYQFLYAGYQRSYQLSIISTNSGDLGNAHSEYIGPLAEQGVLGVIIVVVLFVVTFVTGVRVYRTAADRHVASLALALALGLLTYYIHGFFNNFLDTDKLSVPFWAFTAAIVALDVYSKKLPSHEQ